MSANGQKAFGPVYSERAFHEEFKRQTTDADLKALMETISVYEDFSRTCLDAFEDVLAEMTRCGRKVCSKELADISSIKMGSVRIPYLFEQLLNLLERFSESLRFSQIFETLADRTNPLDWVDRLLQHHVIVQRNKPPMPKIPWFDQFDGGGYAIRPLYRRDEKGKNDGSYVHGYRTGALNSFARDLRMVEL